MSTEFDIELDRNLLSTMKWEAEIDKANSKDLLCFGTADMDFLSPEPIRKALSSVIKTGHFGYPYLRDSYYESIINWFDRNTNWKFSSKAIATNIGIYTSVWNVIDSITDPGDEIIFQPPVHFCFEELIKDNGRKPLRNPLIIRNGEYTIDLEPLQKVVSERTKLFWICNPHNPVGRAWRRDELEKIAEFCLKNNLKIVSDDVYCGLTFEKGTYIPIASISKEVSDISIICVSPSKSYNITGIKHSYIICENQNLMHGYLHSLKKLDLTYGMNIMGIAATEAAYNQCDKWLRDLMDYVRGNYLHLKDSINKNMPLINIYKPDATYFAWLDFRKLELTRKELVDFIECEVKIKIEYGYSFGEEGDGFIRINLACTKSMLTKGIKRLMRAYNFLTKL